MDGRVKKKHKADPPFKSKLANQDGGHPIDITSFKDVMLDAHLMRAAILLEDYDACCGFSTEKRRDHLAC